MSKKGFRVICKDGGTAARRGVLETGHGEVATPVFMPVGTCGAVKGITPRHLEETGASVILANTYHMLLRPGVEVVEKLGGLHKIMCWEKPILTDSGGYQVFSLNSLTRISEDGVEFASHIDGQRIWLDAERATEIQNRLGADIIMCFDECTPFPCEPVTLEKSVERTLRWAGRCRKAHGNESQMLFGIVQGGVNFPLRTHCADELGKMDFDGYSIGGLSVGEGHKLMMDTVEVTTEALPAGKPRYLMGVGTPGDIIGAVMRGVDMFDCVLPARNGRNAYAFTENGPIRLRNSVHIEDTGPIEEGCDCYCCGHFSRGTLRHFFNVNEMLGPIMVSIHNIRFYQRLMCEIRAEIEKGTFKEWGMERLERYSVFTK